MTTSCIFCNILAGRLPASLIYGDDTCAAFLDIQPVNAGHLLVVPRQHAAYLADLDPAVFGHIAKVGWRAAGALRASGLPCEGVNLFLADGESAGQEVFHVHLHVFPRFAGDGFGLKFGPDYGTLPDRPALDAAAARLRSAWPQG